MKDNKPLIAFDIDGTLAAIDHRLHHILQHPKDWESFYGSVDEDAPITPMVFICSTLLKDQDCRVIFVTGRREATRELTEQWLLQNRLVHFHKLYMRPKGDYRKDTEVKKDALKQIQRDFGKKPDMVFEDRPSVVRMWRDAGVFVLSVQQSDEEF